MNHGTREKGAPEHPVQTEETATEFMFMRPALGSTAAWGLKIWLTGRRMRVVGPHIPVATRR
jgi:hypothetical protein